MDVSSRNELQSNRSNNVARPPSRSIYNRELGLNRNTANLYNEYTIELGKAISLVKFSSFDNSFDILACVSQDRVYIYRIKLFNDSEDPSEELKLDYQLVHDYIIGSKATSIEFSPKTNFSQLQDSFLNFAVAGDDFCILILKQSFIDNGSLEDNSEQQYISGHTDYINDMAFDPNTGDYLASASDDCTCCIWALNEEDQKNILEMKILLTSPGINVKWHMSEPNKLFVSEKKGLIRFYDTNSRVAVMSFECNRYPLMSSDWCNDNSIYIGCIASKDIFFWDTSLTSLPTKVLKTNSEGLSEFEFYDSKIVAFRGRPNNFLTVKNFHNNQLYIDKEFVAGRGISWNRKFPILAVGGSKAVHVFKLHTF